jgi:IS1 family transposase
MANMNRLTTEERVRVIAALVEGNSLRATARMTGIARMTIEKLLRDLGTACERYHDTHVRQVRARRVECDEIWSFCYAKAKNVPKERQGFGVGDVWTWVAMDSESKLVISYLVGKRDAGWASEFMQDVAARVANRIQLTTDAHKPYLKAVEGAFGADVDYAMLHKIYGAPSEEEARRYSPARCIGTEMKPIMGSPDYEHVSTSHIERQNLTMRMHMRRFTRLTNAFSKKIENHMDAVALHFMYYNFAKVHQSLRVTPAMEASLTDHVWSLAELVGLLSN